MKFSIITPNYNRQDKILRSVDSAKAWLDVAGEGEIIIVDDGSTDDSVEIIKKTYAADITSGKIVLKILEQNGGVTKAKNNGVKEAQGEWLVFLDSDDSLIADTAKAMSHEILEQGDDIGLMFFRCRDMQKGTLVGEGLDASKSINIKEKMNWRYGECIPVVRRSVANKYPYDEDLLGAEGIAYSRQLAGGIGGRISNIIVREFDCSGDDRLSTRQGLDSRGKQKALTHWRTFSELHPYYTPIQTGIVFIKIVVWHLRYLRYVALRALGLLHLLK